MTAVVNGLRPVITINCPPALARLMRSCWHENPDIRPSFPEISQILKNQWLLSMFGEDEEEYYYPEIRGRMPSSQLLSASSSVSTIAATVSNHRCNSRDNAKTTSSSASPRRNDNCGTCQGEEEDDEATSPREDEHLLTEEKRPR